jgi:hypothetical protein
MIREITPLEAWADFWKWIRLPDNSAVWAGLSRAQKQYLYKANIHAGGGVLGEKRIRALLERYAPERYEFRTSVILHA